MKKNCLSVFVVAMALVFAWAGLGVAQTPVCTESPATWTLWAGQTIPAGTLTVTNDEDTLYVTYIIDTTAYPAAYFGTLHLWAGSDFALLPKNPQGIPVPGQFPYQFNASGLTEYTFEIPLTSLGIVDITTACPLTLYIVAHAEVDLNGNEPGGGETAFGGDQPGTGPRWWFYGKYCLDCEFVPPPNGYICETAFAKGGWVFVTEKKSNPEKLPSLNLIRNRWGWAINITSTGQSTYDIWAGAGLNKTANGTKVGTLTVNWDGTQAVVTYSLTSPYVMEEVHIYAGDYKPTTTAPGQYGNLAYFDPKTGSYVKQISVSDTNSDGIWIIAHAVSCYPAP